jgi:hypothetical protein
VKLKRRTKTSLRRELAYLERMEARSYDSPEAVMRAARKAELIKLLYGEPTKAERKKYFRQWIEWKRTMLRLREAGHEIDTHTEEPIFSKSI